MILGWRCCRSRCRGRGLGLSLGLTPCRGLGRGLGLGLGLFLSLGVKAYDSKSNSFSQIECWSRTMTESCCWFNGDK